MSNYFSTKVAPYVYLLTHKTSGEFYIGFRCSNDVPSSEDLGFKYFTSSKNVKTKFNEFDYQIVAEFFDADSAYQFEQQMIKENFDNPLILNRHWQSTTSYSMLGFKRPDLAEYNKLTKSKPKELRSYKCSWCSVEMIKEEFCHHSPREHYYCNASCKNYFIAKIRPSRKGIPTKGHTAWNKGLTKDTNETIKNMAAALSEKVKGKPAWNKGISTPATQYCGENGRKGAAKMSKTVTGRKRKYLEDGSWTWEYPSQVFVNKELGKTPVTTYAAI